MVLLNGIQNKSIVGGRLPLQSPSHLILFAETLFFHSGRATSWFRIYSFYWKRSRTPTSKNHPFHKEYQVGGRHLLPGRHQCISDIWVFKSSWKLFFILVFLPLATYLLPLTSCLFCPPALFRISFASHSEIINI